ncbi:MAG: hypothetical protein JJU02_04185 [Cryomorphaceae bacterium]|nr:hypothetical protein [Cryomorphaceae bacterium]
MPPINHSGENKVPAQAAPGLTLIVPATVRAPHRLGRSFFGRSAQPCSAASPMAVSYPLQSLAEETSFSQTYSPKIRGGFGRVESTPKRMISIKIEGIFEPEQVRIRKSTDKEDFGRKGLFGADSGLFCLTKSSQ